MGIDQVMFIVPLLVFVGIILVRVLLARLRLAYEGGMRGRRIMLGFASIAFLVIWPVALALVWPLGVTLLVAGAALAIYTLTWSQHSISGVAPGHFRWRGWP